ncbi:MAG: hypothetical protein K0S45_2915 [Nitrospira sp.]|jgi:hypothetical protein|nr:hypothetical protein [Nitrospira sp.]
MSGIYWAIVAGLLGMVATLFVCVDILYSKSNGSLKTTSEQIGDPSEAGAQASARPRQAA